MDEKNKEIDMSDGMSVADAMALTKDNGFGDQVWPLVWLAALGGGGNGLFGGRNNDAAAGVTVAGIEGLQNQINGLLSTINSNTSVAQHQAVQAQLCNLGTIIQSGNADITAAICKCCCDLKTQICDLGYKVEAGNADISAKICEQTNNLTMQNMTNTRDIIDATREEGRETRALINQNTINDKDSQINRCERELSEQKIISQIKEDCGPKCDPCGGNGGSADAQAIAIAVANAMAPMFQNLTLSVQNAACRFPGGPTVSAASPSASV